MAMSITVTKIYVIIAINGSRVGDHKAASDTESFFGVEHRRKVACFLVFYRKRFEVPGTLQFSSILTIPPSID